MRGRIFHLEAATVHETIPQSLPNNYHVPCRGHSAMGFLSGCTTLETGLQTRR